MSATSHQNQNSTRVYNPLRRFEQWLLSILNSGTAEAPRPSFDKHFHSNVPGLYVIGDIAGAPVIKLAMEQGYKVVEHIAKLSDARTEKKGRI